MSTLRRGQVSIEGLQVWCVIGVNETERRQPQPLEIECTLTYRRYPDGEDIEEVIDYTLVTELIRKRAVDGRYQLLERLSREAAEACLEHFPAAEEVAIRVRKPNALEGAAIPSVHVELSRESS